MKRNDVHRPGAIIPSDYEWVLSYELSHSVDGWPVPSFRVNCELDGRHMVDGKCINGVHRPDGTCCIVGLRQIAHVEFLSLEHREQGTGKCDVCGAWYYAGDIWKHKPTGVHIHLGHDCVEKYSMYASRSEWQVWHKQQTALRAQAAKDKRFKVAALRFLEDKPELKAAFELQGETKGHAILKDMNERLNKWGSLSDKQVAFALKLATEINNPAPPKEEERHVPAPEGRTTFTGEIVSTKVHESDFGDVLKMVVKVQTPEGSWLAWLTAPDKIQGGSPLRGQTVTVTATLTRGKDAHFAFGKRPTGASLAS